MFAHVRRTGGGDVGESLLLVEGAGKIFFGGEGGLLSLIISKNSFSLEVALMNK